MTGQHYGSPARAAWAGFLTACAGPAVITAASWISFGVLARQVDLAGWIAPGLTATIWALPAQLLFIDLYGAGASLPVLWLAIAFSSARFLPMTVAIVPMLGRSRSLLATLFAAQCTAVVAWSIGMRRLGALPESERLPFYVGVSTTIWLVGILSTAGGFLLAGPLPPIVGRAMLVATFIYLAILFADQRQQALALAVGFGALGGPVLISLGPEWGILAAGLGFGTAAFALDDRLARRSRAKS